MNAGLYGYPQAIAVSPKYGGAGLQGGLTGFSPQSTPTPIRSIADVSSPPTDAELTATFGVPTNGFRAIVDDGGAGSAFWLVERSNGAWLYVALTKAV